jgi:hypothetical protein
MDNRRRIRLVKNGPAPAANVLQIGGLGVWSITLKLILHEFWNLF